MRYEDRQTYRRTKIGEELRRYRMRLGLTQEAAGHLLDRSQASLSAYENGQFAIRPRDLRYILDQYGVTDEAERTCLLSLAEHGRQRGWWHDFDQRLAPGAVDFASLEAEASRIRIFESQLVHGLFQTEDYARSVIAEAGIAPSPSEIEAEVSFRLRRQRLHDQAQPPRISIVLGEGVLRQMTGGPKFMREQQFKLLDLSQRPHVEMQIIPFSVGPHPGNAGAFTILGVGVYDLLEVVAIDSLTRNWYVDEPSDVDRYRDAFDALQTKALSEEDSRDLLHRVMFDT